jgi:hypothetical protein
MVRFIDKPLLYCDVAVFKSLVEGSQASGEEAKPGHRQGAFAKSTDVFQIMKFIRAMLLIVRDDLTASDILIASESLIVGNVLNLERSPVASEGYSSASSPIGLPASYLLD